MLPLRLMADDLVLQMSINSHLSLQKRKVSSRTFMRLFHVARKIDDLFDSAVSFEERHDPIVMAFSCHRQWSLSLEILTLNVGPCVVNQPLDDFMVPSRYGIL